MHATKSHISANTPNSTEPDTLAINQAPGSSHFAVLNAAHPHSRARISGSSAEESLLWKRRHNELSLVSRLPPEILLIVFEYVVDLLSPQYSSSRRLEWICQMSHICSSWRRFALDCPRLWTSIPFFAPDWAQEMLARSRTAPLTIVVGSRSKFVKPALKQLYRIKKLSLFCIQSYYSHDESTYTDLLASPAPLLESCEITFRMRSNRNELPKNIFSGKAPRLAHLSISQCGLNWRAPIFTNLISLEINSSLEKTVPPADQFISAVSTMARLETLVYNSPLFQTSSEVFMIADLPRLVSVEIRSQLYNCIFILDHIAYPNTTCVTMVCETQWVTKDFECLSSIKRLAENLIKRMHGPARSLAVGEQRIRVWTSPGAYSMRPPVASLLDLDIFWHAVEEETFSMDVTTAILQPLLPLQDLEALTVEGVAFDEAFWVKAFSDLYVLKDIRVVSDEPVAGFLAALETRPAMQSNLATGHQLKFQGLRELTVCEWTLDAEYNSGDVQKTYIEGLMDFLGARDREGKPLNKLTLEECRHADNGDVTELEKIVQNKGKQCEISNYSVSEDGPDLHWYHRVIVIRAYGTFIIARLPAWSHGYGPAYPRLDPSINDNNASCTIPQIGTFQGCKSYKYQGGHACLSAPTAPKSLAMTEYDFSPGAYDRYMATQQRIANWVDNTEGQRPAFGNAFTVQPSVSVSVKEPTSSAAFDAGSHHSRSMLHPQPSSNTLRPSRSQNFYPPPQFLSQPQLSTRHHCSDATVLEGSRAFLPVPSTGAAHHVQHRSVAGHAHTLRTSQSQQFYSHRERSSSRHDSRGRTSHLSPTYVASSGSGNVYAPPGTVILPSHGNTIVISPPGSQPQYVHQPSSHSYAYPGTLAYQVRAASVPPPPAPFTQKIYPPSLPYQQNLHGSSSGAANLLVSPPAVYLMQPIIMPVVEKSRRSKSVGGRKSRRKEKRSRSEVRGV
ncbi:hypothetical protein FPV67DRAFT_1673543 [Lyophyllum atratum]|nr:hypothetical protein FPV67DRAFT_1673543 [Lyophyllum atratum]